MRTFPGDEYYGSQMFPLHHDLFSVAHFSDVHSNKEAFYKSHGKIRGKCEIDYLDYNYSQGAILSTWSMGYIGFQYAQKNFPNHEIVLVGFTGHADHGYPGAECHNFNNEHEIYKKHNIKILFPQIKFDFLTRYKDEIDFIKNLFIDLLHRNAPLSEVCSHAASIVDGRTREEKLLEFEQCDEYVRIKKNIDFCSEHKHEDDVEFVHALFESKLQRTPRLGEINHHVGTIVNGGITRERKTEEMNNCSEYRALQK
jgi:hypothetical protein